MTKNQIPLEARIFQQDRQMRIKNWGVENQEKIANSKVLIIGADDAGQNVIASLAGLGVGEICFMDNSRSSNLRREIMFPILPYGGLRKTERIVEISNSISHSSRITGFFSKFSRKLLEFASFEPDIIIDTTNNYSQREQAIDYAIQKNKKFLSLTQNNFSGEVFVLKNDLKNLDEFFKIEQSEKQGNISVAQGVCSGIMVDETRKSIFSLSEIDLPLTSKFKYNLESYTRNAESDFNLKFNGTDARVLVCGAGAIGNFVAMNLALSGFRNIDIIDFDKTDESNLSRQILLYGRIGENKAEVLSSRITEFSRARSKHYQMKIDENMSDFFKREKFDIMFGCFDNEQARYILNQFAVENRIAYIDGGSSPNMGKSTQYFPGITPCIGCKKNLQKSQKKISCAEVLPSVITTNSVVGALMVGEAINFISGNPLNATIYFDSYSPVRVSITEDNLKSERCKC